MRGGGGDTSFSFAFTLLWLLVRLMFICHLNVFFICLSLKFLLLWISCSYCSTHFYNFGPFHLYMCTSLHIICMWTMLPVYSLKYLLVLFMMHLDHKRHRYFHRFKLADLLLWALEFITCLGRRAFLYKDYKNIQYFLLIYFFYIQLFNPSFFFQSVTGFLKFLPKWIDNFLHIIYYEGVYI